MEKSISPEFKSISPELINRLENLPIELQQEFADSKEHNGFWSRHSPKAGVAYVCGATALISLASSSEGEVMIGGSISFAAMMSIIGYVFPAFMIESGRDDFIKKLEEKHAHSRPAEHQTPIEYYQPLLPEFQ